MDYVKIWKLLQFFGIFILLLCIFFIEGISQNTVELLGAIGPNRISIEAKENLINNNNIGFRENEITQFMNKLQDNEILFTFPFETNIKTSLNTIYVRALAVNSSYKRFSDIHILNGSFLTEKQEQNKEKTLVIEEETALELFKSTDIVGMKINIMNENFRIVGISKRKDSFLSKLFKRKEPQVYIPLQTIFTLNKDITIPCLQISISDKDKSIHNKKAVVKLLDSMGKPSSNYKITYYSILQKHNFQVIQLISFAFGSLIIFHLLKAQIGKIKRTFLTVKENSRSQYFLKSIRLNRKISLYLIIEFLFLASCIYIIIQVIKFDLYIDHESSNMLGYYLDLFIDNFLGVGSSKLFLDSIVNFSEFIISSIFIFGISLGSLLLFSSFYFLRYAYHSLDKTLLFSSILYILSLLGASMIINISKVPLIINIKTSVIIFMFVFLKNMLLITKSESIKTKA